jgi:DeoR/GlpR family transcriptional regulator of sugar metabolism
LGSIPIAELAGQLGVSQATIRRDLEKLAIHHLAEKVRGRAVLVAAPDPEAEPFDADEQEPDPPEEMAVVREALRLIEDGHVVAFGPGTTTRRIAAGLRPKSKKQLTFVTNSISVALTLQENGWEEIVLPGGELRGPSSALVGPHADRTLRMLNVDILFVDVRSLHPNVGPTALCVAEDETTRGLLATARKVVVVIDATELGMSRRGTRHSRKSPTPGPPPGTPA